MTLEQARKAIQKDYPDMEIGLGFEHEGAWYFSVGKNESGGIHAVDNKTGIVTGNLPIMVLIGDSGFMMKFKKATNTQKKSDAYIIEHDAFRLSWREEDFLAHHGILGQKWGVRRFQDENGHLTPEGKIRYNKNSVGQDQAKNGVTPELIVAAVYATPVVVATAAAVTKAAISHHNEKLGDKLLDKKGIADTSKTFSKDNPPKKIDGEHTAEDDMSKVNEAYGGLRPQTLNNCSMCSIAMEARRQGYDVCARTSSKPVVTREQLDRCFVPPPKTDTIGWPSMPKNYDKMTTEEKNNAYKDARSKGEIASSFREVAKNIVSKYPEGARGLFSTVNPYVFVGHAMAFEVKGGKVVIYDCQSNRKFSLASPPPGFSEVFAANSSLTYRLDDKKINWDGMNDICAERIRK